MFNSLSKPKLKLQQISKTGSENVKVQYPEITQHNKSALKSTHCTLSHSCFEQICLVQLSQDRVLAHFGPEDSSNFTLNF